MRKWLPYAPAGMPGVWFDAFQMLPNRAGAYYPNNLFSARTTVTALTSPGATLRAWCTLRPSGALLAFIATTTKIWFYDGATTFTDLSKVGGYTSTATDWSFAQHGDNTIATNRVDAVQVRNGTTGGAFGDLGGSPPKGRIVAINNDIVVLFDINDGSERGDHFAACAPGNITDWSGAGATTATPIRHRSGNITAAVAFLNYWLVFKKSSVYKLTYTGVTANKWRVECIAIGRGAWGMHDVVHCGDSVVFSGPGGAWKYDGASFKPLTDWVGEIPQAGGAIFSPLSQNVHFFTKSSLVTYDTNQGRIYAVTPEQYTYNLVSDRWGTGCFYDATESVNATWFYVPMTGEPAALAAHVAPTTALPDLMWLVNLSATVEIKRNDTYWGGGAGTTAIDAATLRGSVEGIGGNVITYFDRLTPEFTMTLRDLASDPLPDDTELKVIMTTADSMDSLNANTGAAATIAIAGRSSSTAQRRFDLAVAAPYARFDIYLPQNSGYVEIADYQLKMKQAGEL